MWTQLSKRDFVSFWQHTYLLQEGLHHHFQGPLGTCAFLGPFLYEKH